MKKRIRKKKAKQAGTWEKGRRIYTEKYVAKIIEEAVSCMELIMRSPTITEIIERWRQSIDAAATERSRDDRKDDIPFC